MKERNILLYGLRIAIIVFVIFIILIIYTIDRGVSKIGATSTDGEPKAEVQMKSPPFTPEKAEH